MDFHYSVEGRWPFPLDMLRRDMARAATPEDQATIDRLTGPFREDRDAGLGKVAIGLVIENAGRSRPNTARWESFGWDVPGDMEHRMMRQERARRRRTEDLRTSALEKLSDEEREALGVPLPPACS